MSRKTAIALIVALVAALILSSVAYAITIVVDGVREAAWDGVGGQVPGSITDPNEPLITDGYDIQRIQWTNDQTNMYFLVQTYANTITTGFPPPTIIICLDTDNNTATGGSYANCNNMVGIDRSISIDLVNHSVTVFNGAPGGPVLGTGASATQTTFTEVSIPLSLLGFGPGACPAAIPSAVYFDNGITDPDDRVPDLGTTNIGCGTPTAVTLSSLQAQPTTSPVLPVALVGVSAIALIGVVLFARRRKTA